MNAHDIAAPHEAAAEAVAALLRCELAAAETYDLAVGTFEGACESTAAELGRIREGHRAAAAALRDRVLAHGGTPPEAAGPGGPFHAAGVGPAAVLYGLKRGEEHVTGEYEAALTDPAVHPDCKDLIRSDLLPRARARVVDLDRLMAGK